MWLLADMLCERPVAKEGFPMQFRMFIIKLYLGITSAAFAVSTFVAVSPITLYK